MADSLKNINAEGLPSGRYIDFHSHMIPKMDDGSRSVEESIQMLQASVEQGVCCIALTPHFYAESDDPEHFLKKRERMFMELKQNYNSAFPVLLPGAEVHYFEGLTYMEALGKMRIGSSSALLIEMPRCHWTTRMVDDVLEIHGRRGYTVVLAHIERYLGFKNDAAMQKLRERGVLMQSNASFFDGILSSGKAIRLLERGYIHLLGSDTHNMTTRPPNIGKACGKIKEKCGPEILRRIIDRSFDLLMRDVHADSEKHSARV